MNKEQLKTVGATAVVTAGIVGGLLYSPGAVAINQIPVENTSVEARAEQRTVAQKEIQQLEVLKAKRFAEGGSVSYDPSRIEQIMSSISAPQNYAEGGSVSAYDSGRVDAIVNQFM
jgi:hypothetical protein